MKSILLRCGRVIYWGEADELSLFGSSDEDSEDCMERIGKKRKLN